MQKKPHRPASIACISGPPDNEAEFLRLANEAAAQKPDLVVLPEAWQGFDDGPDRDAALLRLQEIAGKYGVYIINPTLLTENEFRHNTALVLGRDGEIIGRYDKTYPYWSELPQTAPGGRFKAVDLDFGRIAVLICFDANFPCVWEEAATQGAELVIWASAYGGGMQLAAHALNYHFPIVTSTLTGHSMAFDIDGRRVVNVKSDGHFAQFYELDLDRRIFHENFNEEKLEKLLNESPRRVEIEKHWPDEQWIIVRSAQAGASAATVCREAGMEELRHYKFRSRAQIDEMRRG